MNFQDGQHGCCAAKESTGLTAFLLIAWMWEMLINAALMVRNQVCKRRHSRSIDFLAIKRRLYCVYSNNVQNVNHITKNLKRFEVKNNCVNFSCNRCVYIPWEHQSFIENSDHRNIFADLQNGQNRIIIPVMSLKLLSVLNWWFAFFSVLIFCFTCVHYKSEPQLCEVSWKTDPRIEVLLHVQFVK